MSVAVLVPDRLAEIAELELDAAMPLLGATPVEPRYAFADARWMHAWASAFLRGNWRGPVRVYAQPGTQGCEGFIAFADQRVKGFPMKALAGYYWPFRSVCVTATARAGFALSLARHFKNRPPAAVLRFGPIHDQDAGVRAVINALQETGWRILRKRAGEVLTQRLTTIEALHETMPASLHKSIRKRLRRMAREAGEPVYERHSLMGDCGALLDELAAVADMTWQGSAGGTAKFLGASEATFWRAMAATAPVGAKPVVWLLRCNGRVVAFQLQIETPGLIYKIGCGYDPAWRSYSPGTLLSYAILTSVCEQGGAWIDWGRGDSGYKQTWGAQCDGHLVEALLFQPSLLGRVIYALACRVLPTWTRVEEASSV